MYRFQLFIVFTFLFFYQSNAQPKNSSVKLQPLINKKTKWVDSIYNSLSIEQKIGQLFMVAAYSGGEKYNQPLIEKLITENQIGGLIFMQGTPLAQAEQTNAFQRISNVPLLIAMDAEWGIGMRLKEVLNLPKQLMLGAMKDSTIVYKIGAAVAAQCKRLGVHIDFAPVVDVNNNPNNPVINFRSFGENKYKVANYGIQYMRGLQQNGVMACAKHFPGHGDVNVDSHKDLPVINKSMAELEKLELYPFDVLIRNGIQSIMVAHLQVPAIDNKANTPTTLSAKAITDLLKNKMKFNGLIFTDALNMQGVAKYYAPGEVDVNAFKAGNDVLLFSQDVPKAIQQLKEAIDKKTIPMSRIEESVKKILKAKYDAGLNNFLEIDETNLEADLNKNAIALRTEVAVNAITLLNDDNKIIDKIAKGNAKNTCYVGVGTKAETDFSKALKTEGITDFYYAPTNIADINTLVKKCKNYSAVIIGIHGSTGYPTKNFNIDSVQLAVVNALSKNNNTIITLFGNPYAAKNFLKQGSLLVAYDEATETQLVTSKILYKRLLPLGTTPVKISTEYPVGSGVVSTKYATPITTITDSSRFVKSTPMQDVVSDISYVGNPDMVGANTNELAKLDAYLKSMITQNVFPGCSFLAAKGGRIFYNKSFGYTNYDKYTKIDSNTLYDIASCTKVCATTMAVMKLYDQGKLDINATLGKYLTIVRGTDKEYLKIKDVLLHQAGLKSWVPFYKETLDSTGYPRSSIYQKNSGGEYTVKVCNNLFMNRNWIDTMWNRILYSPLENRGKYVYSDLDFIFLQKVVERISGKSLDDYVRQEYYIPLGLKNICFLPRKNNPTKVIAPSENDNYFRHQVVQGFVHDMGAAMFGGVSGHAGLFSTPHDMAVLFQLLLNGGVYGGKRYLKKSTVDLFTSKGSMISRRGLGFDRVETIKGKSNPVTDECSNQTFGHTGFTGTCAWADASNDILVVFLSNRTFPSAENKAINSKNVRERAQQYIYNSLGIYTKK